MRHRRCSISSRCQRRRAALPILQINCRRAAICRRRTASFRAMSRRKRRAPELLVDSHCHLDFADFAPEREAVIERARAAGIGTMVTICTRLDEFPAVRAIAEAHADIWCSVGVHPHEAADHAEATAVELARLAEHPRVIGIGETGLDFHYDHSPREVQEQVFRTHIAASRASGVPLIIHAREADDAVARILAEEQAPAGVLHCFSSGRGLADAALELGFYISISGIVT